MAYWLWLNSQWLALIKIENYTYKKPFSQRAHLKNKQVRPSTKAHSGQERRLCHTSRQFLSISFLNPSSTDLTPTVYSLMDKSKINWLPESATCVQCSGLPMKRGGFMRCKYQGCWGEGGWSMGDTGGKTWGLVLQTPQQGSHLLSSAGKLPPEGCVVRSEATTEFSCPIKIDNLL